MPVIKGGFHIKKGKVVKGNLGLVGLPFKATGWKSERMPENTVVESDKPKPKKSPKKKSPRVKKKRHHKR